MTEEVAAAQAELPQPSIGIVATLLLRSGLAKNVRQALLHSVLLFWLITCLPVLLLCQSAGSIFSDSLQVPLLGDYISSARFIVVAPILILSDLVTQQWLLKTVKHFLHDHIAASDLAAYQKFVVKNFQLRDASIVVLLLLLLAFAYAPVWIDIVLAVKVSNWQVLTESGQPVLSLAGKWNAYVSQPLFRFIVLDWLWGYLLWASLLFRVSRFQLRVSPTHPDCAGGLGFIAIGQSYYGFSAFAMSVGVCTFVAQAVLETHAPLQGFTNLGIVFVILVLLLFLGPLMVFTPLLIKSKREAVFTYGSLCHQVNSLFATTWLSSPKDREPADSPALISSSEPSTVTDLNASFLNIQNMKPFVFGKETLVTFIAAVALPAIPLIATVIPLKELLKELAKALT